MKSTFSGLHLSELLDGRHLNELRDIHQQVGHSVSRPGALQGVIIWQGNTYKPMY